MEIAYFGNAMNVIRCLLAAVLLLVFGGGMTMLPAQSSETLRSAVEATADQAAPEGCDRCHTSDLAMAAGACFALGTCVQAVVGPIELVLMRARAVFSSHGLNQLIGFRGLPEPFPPKTRILV
jgi:hypothetical protein